MIKQLSPILLIVTLFGLVSLCGNTKQIKIQTTKKIQIAPTKSQSTGMPTIATATAPTSPKKTIKIIKPTSTTVVKTTQVSSTGTSASAKSTASISSAQGSNANIDSALADTIEQYFSVFPDPGQTEYALLPNLDKAITIIYQDTLHLPPVLIQAIRRFYSFLQAQVFDEKFSKEQLAIAGLQTKIEIAIQKHDPALDSLQKDLEKARNNYWQEIKKLDGSIVDLCAQSNFWQTYLQSFIASSFDYEYSLLGITHKDEKEIFSMLPQFEIAYYTKDFTALRIDAEIVRTFLVLLELVRERLILQSTAWSKIESQELLYDAIAEFKNSAQFITQKAFTDATFSTKLYPLPADATILTTQGAIAPGFKDFFESTVVDGKNVVSPAKRLTKMISIDTKTNAISLTELGKLLITYVPASKNSSATLSYTPFFSQLFQATTDGYVPTKLYMTFLGFSGIKLINGALEYLFNTANLESTMAQLSTLDQNLLKKFPFINPYQPSDYLYLDDINFLKAGSSTLDKQISAAQANGASAQSIFSKIKKAFTKAGNAIASGVTKAANFVGNNTVEMANTVKDASQTFAKQALSDIKSVTSNAIEAAKDLGYVTRDLSMAVGYDIAYASTAAFTNDTKFAKKANESMKNAMSNFNNLFEQGFKIIDGIGELGKTTLHLAGNLVLNGGLMALGPLGYGATVFLTLSGENFREEITKFVETTADLVMDVTIMGANVGYGYLVTPMVLTSEAIMFATQAIVTLTTGDVSDITSLGLEFLKDTVASLLRPVKLAFNGFSKSMTDLMLATAYLAGTIVDATINIGGAVAAAAAVTYGGDPTAAFNNIKEKVNEHRRLITSIIGIVIISAATIATSVATGGSASCPMLLGLTALFAGMMALESQGEHEKDLDAIKETAEQVEFVEKFEKYVHDSEKTSQVTQSLIQKDLELQYEDIVQNQERSLLFYQNYLNTNLNTSVATSAYGIGSFYNQLLTPSGSTGIPYADIGQTVGIQTNRFNLNPAQGMATYNAQRNTFAQEIATMPEQTISDQQENSLEINKGITKFWLNQKDISAITESSLAGEIRFRTLYESKGAFYIGLFLTNQIIDKETLNALYKNFNDAQTLTGPQAESLRQKIWANIESVNRHILNFNNNGKAFVIYRENLRTAPKLGLYEHSKNGWIAPNIAPISYQTGVWQRMKMKIENNKMYVKCWPEATAEPTQWQGSYATTLNPKFPYPAPLDLSSGLTKQSTSTANVIAVGPKAPQIFDQKTQQWIEYKFPQTNIVNPPVTGSLGVITSGAAVEYEVLTPKQTIQRSKARLDSDQTIKQTFTQANLDPYEIDREKNMRSQASQATAVKFGSLTLTPVSAELINQGIYLYTTSDTNTSKNIDYVVFASATAKDSKSGLVTATGLGSNLGQKPTLVVSIITGKAYDQNKNNVETCVSVYTSYTTAAQLTNDIIQKLTDSITTLRATDLTQIVLSGLTLVPESGAISNNMFIYSAPSLTSGLTGKDYFVTAQLTASGNLVSTYSYGQKMDVTNTTITGMISLVTGKPYTFAVNNIPIKTLIGQDLKKVSLTPIKDAPIYSNLLVNYSQIIDPTLYGAVQKQNAAFTTASFTQTPKSTSPVITTPPPPSTVSLSSLEIPDTIDTKASDNFNDLFDYDTAGF